VSNAPLRYIYYFFTSSVSIYCCLLLTCSLKSEVAALDKTKAKAQSA